jgi:hypothetical protein
LRALQKLSICPSPATARTTSPCICSRRGPNRSYLEAHGFDLDRYIEHPLVLEDDSALAPTRLGYGINFDWAALSRLVG